ncbi:MAG: hypothetical protein ACC683_04275 [Acidimicrobiia bacterium]
MHSLILAAENVEQVTTGPAGDEFMTVALVMLAIAMVIAAIATLRVTPKADHH